MKLVELLAKELAEWPEEVVSYFQWGNSEIYATAVGVPTHYEFSMWMVLGEGIKMAYKAPMYGNRLPLAADHATAIVTREMWQAERERSVTGVGVSGDAVPLQWRDRIREIDATIEAVTAERAELVSKLAGEGFALIAVAVESVDDMSDWRNWKAGDLVECLSDAHKQFTKGRLYKIKEVARYSVMVDEDDKGATSNGWGHSNFEWHSRPSA